MHAAVALAGFFAPYDGTAQNRDMPLAPPTRLHFGTGPGLNRWRPYVCQWSESPVDPRRYAEDCRRRYPVRLLVRGAPHTIAGVVSSPWRLFGVDSPGRVFLIGSDAFGRDVFSRLLEGGQISLLAGLTAAAVSVGLGLFLGCLAGFFGGRLDEAVMRVADLFFALPWLYLLLAVRAFLPLSIDSRGAFLLVIGILGIVGWARPARLVRGVVLSSRHRKYVVAARGFGGSNLYLLRRHVLPQTLGLVAIHAAILVPQFILVEVTLSFLGLGVGEPVASWGNMLGGAQQYHTLSSHPWVLAPGFALVPILFCYGALADRLQRRARIVPL